MQKPSVNANVAAVQAAMLVILSKTHSPALPIVAGFFKKLAAHPEVIVVLDKVLDFVEGNELSLETWSRAFRAALDEYTVEKLIRETLRMTRVALPARRPKGLDEASWKRLRAEARDQTG